MTGVTMFKYLNIGTVSLAVFITALFSPVNELSAAPRKAYASKPYSIKSSNKTSHSTKSYKTKPYVKKAPYEGYGKLSKVSGRPKTQIASGHVKKTSKGYTYVNPYARSM